MSACLRSAEVTPLSAEVTPLSAAGERSVARRLLRCAAPLLSDGQTARSLASASSSGDIQAVMRRSGAQFPDLQRLATVVLQPVTTPQV